MRNVRPVAIAVAKVALALASGAHAHERDFTLSRDWYLPYQGEHEVESRTFWQLQPNDLVQQFEYEYGVTDHFAIEPGVIFKKPNADHFDLEAIDFELRFNFFEFDFNKLLPAFNLEYERRIEDDDEDAASGDEEEAKNEAEFKGIVSLYTKRGEDFTVNVNFGKGFGGEGEKEWEGEITAGYLRPIDFIPGIEPSKEHPLRGGRRGRICLRSTAGVRACWRARTTVERPSLAPCGARRRDDPPRICTLGAPPRGRVDRSSGGIRRSGRAGPGRGRR